MKHNGFFITLEKTSDGLGGTTQAKILCSNLNELGIEAIYTREPGGTEETEQLRNILKNAKYDICPQSELLWMIADRAQHVYKKIIPALRDGKVVICDRYFDSTLLYQGIGRNWDTNFLEYLHKFATDSLYPDLTFVLDGIPHREMDENDRFEQFGDDFFARGRRWFLQQVETSERYYMINSNRNKQMNSDEILKVALERIEAKRNAS